MTWRELIERLEGCGLIVMDYDEIDGELMNLGTSLDDDVNDGIDEL